MEYNLENAIEQMRAGEEAGLNYVYSKTYNYVYLRAKNILKKETDIQLLMKDVYVQAMNKASEIQKENLYVWLGTCVYTLGCQRFRKKKAREALINVIVGILIAIVFVAVVEIILNQDFVARLFKPVQSRYGRRIRLCS